MADQHRGYRNPKPKNRFAEKIAVIGSGPAGLTAAYFLAWEGYPVTIFEAMQEPGGMLVTGILNSDFPRHYPQGNRGHSGYGSRNRRESTVGRDITLDDLRAQGYSAFFLGIGAWDT